MASSSVIFSTFWLLAALICVPNLMAVVQDEDEDPPMALLPFGSAFRLGTFTPCQGAPHPNDETATITVKNNCSSTIWPATSTSFSVQPQVPTGFELARGASRSLKVATPWSGRVWARTHCSNSGKRFSCLTGDCSGQGLQCSEAFGVPPATAVELSLAASNGGQDLYDVSLVDGFNLPASIATQGGTGPCKSSNCRADVNEACPLEQQVKSGDEVIACKNGCSQQDDVSQTQNCCTGKGCAPNTYSQFFKIHCPDAYSSYDDNTSAFTCNSRPNYVITFCA